MEPLLDLLGKFLGAQWLWNLATLALLLQAYKAFDKLRKLPADALSKAEFQKYKEAADARFSTIESPLNLVASRVNTMWNKLGMSDPRVPRVDVHIDAGSDPRDRTYGENIEVVENDPWPRRRATDRLLTPVGTPQSEPIDARDEDRFSRPSPVREGRGSDPGRRPIPREEPVGPPSDRPFESDTRDRRDRRDRDRDRSSFDGEPFDEDSPVPPRPKKR